MIDHVILNVKDVARSKRFYQSALAPLGYTILLEFPEGVGFGIEGKPDFWISHREPHQTGVHVAFHCKTRKLVDAFWRGAREGGGEEHGDPGLRPHYHPAYYAAFVLDPDGNNIEAVCHDPKG